MSNLSQKMIFDFLKTGTSADWKAIDDRIMGGLSQSQPRGIDAVGLRFSGEVSLENNGGFASIRSESGHFDLSQFAGLKLRLRGDGKSYKLSLRTDVFFDGVSYQADFGTQKDIWQEIELPFSTFAPTHHGILLSTVAPMDTSDVRSFGVFISGGQEGSFQLDISWIKGI